MGKLPPGRPKALLGFERWLEAQGVTLAEGITMRDCNPESGDSAKPNASGVPHYAVFAANTITEGDQLFTIPKVWHPSRRALLNTRICSCN
jgi:hypothetical protein